MSELNETPAPLCRCGKPLHEHWRWRPCPEGRVEFVRAHEFGPLPAWAVRFMSGQPWYDLWREDEGPKS